MPRQRRTAEQWQALIEQHAQSPLSVAEFCRNQNLSLSSFHRWRSIFRHKLQPGFLEIKPPRDAEDSQATWHLEVDLPGGGHLRLRFEP
jgi:transposase-like protein